MVGHVLERHRVVVFDAAVADLVAVTVEESDREVGFLQPVVVGRFPERGEGEQEHEQEAASAERRPLRDRLDQEPSPPAGDVAMVHERGEALIYLARPFAAFENGGIDARVEIEQQPLELELPIRTRIRKQVRHA
jgi:hypothetical protein